MNTVIIETIVSVAANLAITLIGVLGAWLVAQIGKTQQLKTINYGYGLCKGRTGRQTSRCRSVILDLIDRYAL